LDSWSLRVCVFTIHITEMIPFFTFVLFTKSESQKIGA
jgi:hypothetical protein